MPTPKQVRYHYKRMMYRWRQLQNALNDAHNASVIKYPDGAYRDEAPCASHWVTRDKIDATTEKNLANAMRSEIKKEMKNEF
jgi:hypothetical protein